MSSIQSEFTEYIPSQDEIMLKELERRDGIYSFIFHELETPAKDILQLEKSASKELQKMFVKKPHDRLLIADGKCKNITDETAIDQEQVPQQHSTCKMEVDALANVTTKLSQASTSQQPAIIGSSLTYSNLKNSKMLATTTREDCSHNDTYKNSTNEYLKTWQPPAFFSMPLPLHSTDDNHRPLCLFDPSKFPNILSTGVGFRVRKPTPRFSHINAPMVRNRRHVLKETPEYKNYIRNIARTPDLRELFPNDPDVHAPFAEISTKEESFNGIGENQVTI